MPPGPIDDVLDDLITFVEEERGLTFEQRPEVRVAPDDEFEPALLERVAGVEDLVAQDETLYRALGLIDADADLLELSKLSMAEAVLGFYDPETNELLVRGEGDGHFLRQVVVHELTHALDDQRFDLDRPELDRAPDESSFGFSALVEGSATRVENAYLEDLSTFQKDQAENEAAWFSHEIDSVEGGSIALATLSYAPYTYGERLVDSLAGGGLDELDAAFDAPPLTSEQVLFPTRYERREPAVEVSPPSADGAVVDRGVLGALMIDTLLTGGIDSLYGDGLGDAADGWGGDAYVTWRDAAGRSCARFRVVGDTPADTAELQVAFVDWQVDRAALDVRRARQCGRGHRLPLSSSTTRYRRRRVRRHGPPLLTRTARSLVDVAVATSVAAIGSGLPSTVHAAGRRRRPAGRGPGGRNAPPHPGRRSPARGRGRRPSRRVRLLGSAAGPPSPPAPGGVGRAGRRRHRRRRPRAGRPPLPRHRRPAPRAAGRRPRRLRDAVRLDGRAAGGGAGVIPLAGAAWLALAPALVSLVAEATGQDEKRLQLIRLSAFGLLHPLPAYPLLAAAVAGRRRLLGNGGGAGCGPPRRAGVQRARRSRRRWRDRRWYRVHRRHRQPGPGPAKRGRPRRALLELDPDLLLVQELTPATLEGLRAGGLPDRFAHRFEDPEERVLRLGHLQPASDRRSRGGGARSATDGDGNGRAGRPAGDGRARPHPGPGQATRPAAVADRFRRPRRGGRPCPGPVVLAGDWNATWASRPFRRTVRCHGLRDAHASVGRPLVRTWPTHRRPLPPLLGLDRVVVSADVGVLAVDEHDGPGSDHRIVRARLRLH